MSDLNPKFIVFNNVIISTLHIRWCELEQRKYSDGNAFGIKVVVNTGSGCETFHKWFVTQSDRDEEYNRLSDKILRAYEI